MKGREFVRFECWFGNLWRKFCNCGEPATGYRSMGADIDVEFFCDEHFQDVPSPSDPAVVATGDSRPHADHAREI